MNKGILSMSIVKVMVNDRFEQIDRLILECSQAPTEIIVDSKDEIVKFSDRGMPIDKLSG